MFAQRAAGLLIQGFYVLAHIRPVQNTQTFDHLKGKTARHARKTFVALHIDQWFK